MDIQDRTVGIQPSPLLSAACNAFTHISFDTQVPSHTDTLHRDAFAHRYFHTDRSFYSQQFYAQKMFTHKKKLHADVSTYTKKHVHTVAFSPSNWYKQKVFCTQQFLRAENFLYTEKHRSVVMFLHTNNILHQGAFAHFAHSCYTEKVFAQMFPLKGFTNIIFCTQSLLKTHVRIGRWCRQRIGRCFWIPRTGTGRRKFRSQTSDNMGGWKAEQGRGREKRKIRREKIRRERVRRQKMQMREKVGKSRNTVFFQWFGAPEGRKVGSLKRRVRSQLARWEMKICTPLWRTFWSQNVQNTPWSDHFWKLRCRKSARRCGAKHISKWKCTKHLSVGPLLEVEMSKKCTPLWREAHFQVKMYKAHHSRTTFGSWDVEKVHAVVARSTFPSQKC